jgi:hypothetical protein
MASNLPRLVAVSGPLQDQILKVDENGAFVLDVDASRNADGSAWAVPIIQRERRLGVVYVEIDKDIEMDSDVIVELRGIADVSNDPDFPENRNRFF